MMFSYSLSFMHYRSCDRVLAVGDVRPLRRSSGTLPRSAAAPQTTRRHRITLATTASSSSGAATATQQNRPPWAGGGVVSSVVNALINSPLYALMVPLARATLRNNAEKQGVPWREHVAALEADGRLERIRTELEDKAVAYPPYYLQPFHAYKNGNLEFLAAYEAEPATLSISTRAFKDPALTPQQAHAKLRANIVATLKDYMATNRCRAVADVLDVGCSVGMSTRSLAESFPDASVTGLDLSPYFLAVAELREREHFGETTTSSSSSAASTSSPQQQHQQRGRGRGRGRIAYVHGLAEATPYADASFDVVSIAYVFHECPEAAINALLAEARRILRPNGTLLVVDTDPESPVLQRLPPALFTLQKATEPHADSYYSTQLQAAMQRAGFAGVQTSACSPRHRCVVATAAAAAAV